MLAPLLASYYGQLPMVGGVFHCEDPSITHTYTGDTVTAVTETLEANWTSLTETKTDEAVTTVLRNAFANFGKFKIQSKVSICVLKCLPAILDVFLN